METNHTLSIGCAILAGGKSTRMHRDKALLELDGIPYIQRIANQLGDFRERILSGNSKELSQSIGFRHVPDLFPDCGPMSGIYSALQASTSDAVFFVACDMPYFTQAIAAYLCSRMTPQDTGVITVDPSGHIQPLCAIYHKSMLPQIYQCLAENKCKLLPLLEDTGCRFIHIPHEIASTAQFLNVNTPQDIP